MSPISGSTRLTAVIGSPVRHSLSPAIHNAAFERASLDWRMFAFEVAPGDGADAVRSMRTLGIGGLAVTMPHKGDVAAAVDEVDPAASALESVNTVVLRPDGSTFGASTDGAGFVNAVTAQRIVLEGSRVAMLGAGAAGRSIIDALGRAGVADIAIINRTPGNAEAAASLATMARVGTVDDIDSADLLVNTTSVGMGTEINPIDPARLRTDLAVADIVYHPIDTALLTAARRLGASTVDGLAMLIEQARLQQQLWTGVLPDAASMRTAAETALG